MIGALVGGGLKAVGSIFGAVEGAKSARKANKMINKQKSSNQAWYDKNYNEKFTQRADAQDVLEQTRKTLAERTQRAAATNTVMGGTDEAIAMEKAAANQAVSDTAAQINAQGANHKANVENQYLQQDNNLTQQQIGNEQQRGQNIARAASGVSAGAAGIVGSIFDKKDE